MLDLDWILLSATGVGIERQGSSDGRPEPLCQDLGLVGSWRQAEELLQASSSTHILLIPVQNHASFSYSICMHICMYVYIYIYIYIMCVCVCVCVCVYVCMYIYICLIYRILQQYYPFGHFHINSRPPVYQWQMGTNSWNVENNTLISHIVPKSKQLQDTQLSYRNTTPLAL
jgi:hypothetical protein